MKPQRIQLSRKRGWRKPAGAVNCSRPGKWGNPFILDPLRPTPNGKPFSVWREEDHGNGFFGRTLVSGYDTIDEARRNAVGFFAAHMLASAPRELFDAVKTELRGKSLCCWCRLCPVHANGKPWDVECSACAPCHVDVLLKIANATKET